jgi:hypothetical protein
MVIFREVVRMRCCKMMLITAAVLAIMLAGRGPADGVIPLERARELHFQQLDKNRDGKVSREEFLAPWKANREIAEQQFRQFDKNGDGFITPDEYIPSRGKKPDSK